MVSTHGIQRGNPLGNPKGKLEEKMGITESATTWWGDDTSGVSSSNYGNKKVVRTIRQERSINLPELSRAHTMITLATDKTKFK